MELKQQKPRILIYVENGEVQQVLSNCDMELVMLDFDTFKNKPNTKQLFDDRIENVSAHKDFKRILDNYRNLWNQSMEKAFAEQ